jgi:hypothetical protein
MLEFFIASLGVALSIAIVFTWFFCLVDLFLRGDLTGWGKAGWLAAIIFFPILGSVVYIVRRPEDSHWFAKSGYAEIEAHSREWQIQQVETLIRLRNQGSITEAQFQSVKQRVLA